MTRPWPHLAPPIAVQILALLVGGLVAAQLATLALSLLLPPPPSPQYRLSDIAAALRGGPLRNSGLPPLERGVQTRPPDARSPGWQVSEASRRSLAQVLGAAPEDVQLLFYSPPPFAGADPRGDVAERAGSRARIIEANLFAPLMMAPPPGGGPGEASGPGGQGGSGGGTGAPLGARGSRGHGSGGQAPSGGVGPGGEAGGPPQAFDPPMAPVPRGAPDGGPVGSASSDHGASEASSLGVGEPEGARSAIGRSASPDAPIQTAPVGGLSSGGGPGAGRSGPGGSGRSGLEPLGFAPSALAALQAPMTPSAGLPLGRAQEIDPPVHISRGMFAPAGQPKMQTPFSAPIPPDIDPTQTVVTAPARVVSPFTTGGAASAQPLPPPVARTLFGLARTPMVNGEFLAALRLGPHRWVTVRPLQDSILSPWQRRIALWFLVSFAAVAPIGYLFSRRLAAPLAELADTADRLGRDASTPVRLAAGAPEIRRLALAFSSMQARLQRHVEDRTAMVGAISHDLRTPLARLRFKLERAPPALKSSMQRDLTQMEEMLESVLLFIRDASEPGLREMADLRSIVECVVDDAALVGGDVALEPGEDAAVEVDILAVQRVVSNLVENAMKYGGEARVRLLSTAGDAVLEVTDRGPGLPEAELEKVFQPFYRSEEGRQASAKGIGLGLSVSRSIARTHGGDISLRNGEGGLVAELRLPLGGRRPKARAPAEQMEVLTSAA